MSAVPERGAQGLAPRANTMAQRTALRLMHTGALLRAGGNTNWYCRAFPKHPVRDDTLQSLVKRGLARVESYRGLYLDERECAVLTPAGEAVNCGVRIAAPPPPPVAAEVVLREVEAALAVLDADAQKLRAEILQDSAAALEIRRTLAEAEAKIAQAEKRLHQRERARESLNQRRVDLRALVAHACERLGAEIAGARQ